MGLWSEHGFSSDAIKRAQGGRCYLCGQRPLIAAQGTPDRKRQNRAGRLTVDHVVPRARGGRNGPNKLLAHQMCNERKGDRFPFPCELLYLEITNKLAARTMIKGWRPIFIPPE